MKINLYWVETSTLGRLATMARPRAGDWLEDEVRNLKSAGVDTVVSLLEDSEVAELGLECERAACESLGVAFHSFPIATGACRPSTKRRAPSFERCVMSSSRVAHSRFTAAPESAARR